MLQVSYSTDAEHVELLEDRDNSETPASAAALVRNVREAVRSVSTVRPDDLHANAETWQVLTSGMQNSGRRTIDPPPVPIRSAPRASLHAIQEWEGHVVVVGEADFVARLVDVTAGDSHEGEEAVIPRAELSEGDDAKMKPGSVFRWVIGYQCSPEGTKERVSRIVFRDLPAVTPNDVREGEDWAQEIARTLIP